MKKGFLKCIAVIMVVLMTAVYMPVADITELFTVEASAASYSGSLGGNVKWSYDSSNKTVVVSGSGTMGNYGSTPGDFTKYRAALVGYIYRQATKIVINNGVTSIGNYAFKDFQKVTEVSIPNSVTSIGNSAFEGCSALTKVTMSNSVKSIGTNSFKNTKYSAVTLPDTLSSIGSGAFSGVSGLKITCNYGTYAYEYCVKNSVSCAFPQNKLLAEANLDVAEKQVVVKLKMVYNKANFNAGNFTLTYSNSVVPESTETVYTNENGIAVAAVHENGKINFAVMAQTYVPYSTSVGVCVYDFGEIRFNVADQQDNAAFTFESKVLMMNNAKTTINAASASVGLHVYSDTVLTPATCKETGTMLKGCSVCGRGDEVEIPVDANNHKGETKIVDVKESNCKDKGYTGDIICLDCNAVISKGNVIGATGNHDYNAVVTDATCTAEGFTTYTCKVCGDSYQADKTPVKAHDYNAVVTEATCAAEGFTTYTCKVCGDSYQADKTPVKDHDYNIVVTAPTCTEGGFSVYTCKTCSDTATKDITEALNHDFDANGECSRCDETIDVSISFKDAVYVVDNEAKIVYVKKTVKSGEMLADVVSGNWVVCDSEGTALAEDKQVVTCNVIKAEKSDLAYTISILGDVNCDGKVNALDARSVLRVAAQLDEKTEVFVIAGDCDGKAGISAMDARIILRVGAQMQTFA